MTKNRCYRCGYLFDAGDKVKALVITEWVPLKSKVVFALGHPTACEEVYHISCQHPQGLPEGD